MANTPSGGGGEEVIPESILSLSKDGRYVEQCQELLLKLVSFLFEQKESSVSTATNPEQKLARKHTTWLISCLLYALASARTGRTLGMQAVGLNFSTDHSVTLQSQNGATSGLRQRRRFIFLCLSLLSVATGSLVLDYFKENSEADPKEGENQEQSRGRQRRLIHERLRRQMLERAANLEGDSAFSTGSDTSNQQTQGQTELVRGNTTTQNSAIRSCRSEQFLSIFRQLSKVGICPVFAFQSNMR